MMEEKGNLLCIVVFWVVTPCSLAGAYQRFVGAYRPHLKGRNLLTTFMDLLTFREYYVRLPPFFVSLYGIIPDRLTFIRI